jgi:hypothetical protein
MQRQLKTFLRKALGQRFANAPCGAGDEDNSL